MMLTVRDTNPATLLDEVSSALGVASSMPKDASNWAAIPLVAALERACILALSSYETAQEADILEPANARAIAAWDASTETPIVKGARPPARIAPLVLLLRRVRSEDYLAAPERLTLPMKTSKGIKALVSLRNGLLHHVPDFAPPEPETLPRGVSLNTSTLDFV